MCNNLQWQMCALTGLLPGQGSKDIHFATAPKDLQLKWWSDPSTHPTYPCNVDTCDPAGYTAGDVFFAETAITAFLCSNRRELFSLNAGDLFECSFDERACSTLVERLTAS